MPLPGGGSPRPVGSQELLRLSPVRAPCVHYTGEVTITDVGLVMIIAWILGALQGVLLLELISAVVHYVKLRAQEERSRWKIMSSYGPRAPWV